MWLSELASSAPASPRPPLWATCPDWASTPTSTALSPRSQVHASGLQGAFARIREHMQADARRSAKLDQRVGLLTAGYQKRAGELSGALATAHKERQDAGAELVAFKVLFAQARSAVRSGCACWGVLLG